MNNPPSLHSHNLCFKPDNHLTTARQQKLSIIEAVITLGMLFFCRWSDISFFFFFFFLLLLFQQHQTRWVKISLFIVPFSSDTITVKTTCITRYIIVDTCHVLWSNKLCSRSQLPLMRMSGGFRVVWVLYEYQMKDLTHPHIQNFSWRCDEDTRFCFPSCLTDDAQFCLPTPITSIYFGSAGMCMFACTDFHDAIFKMHLYAGLCVCVCACVCACVCVPVMLQMYELQQVSLWCECIIQALWAGAASDTTSQVSHFSAPAAL